MLGCTSPCSRQEVSNSRALRGKEETSKGGLARRGKKSGGHLSLMERKRERSWQVSKLLRAKARRAMGKGERNIRGGLEKSFPIQFHYDLAAQAPLASYAAQKGEWTGFSTTERPRPTI